jgi:anthranilate synthase component 1
VHRALPERYPFLLESAARGGERARFDLLFAFPEGRLALHPGGELSSDSVDLTHGDFLTHLDRWMAHTRRPVESPPPVPFFGGWFVYLGYELVAQTEPSVSLPEERGHRAVAEAHRIPAAIIRDHMSGDTVLVAESDRLHCLDRMEQDLRTVVVRDDVGHGVGDGITGRASQGLPVQPEEDRPEQFLDGVARIKRYIRDGDVFQVNLSRGWRGRLAGGVDPAAVYARLRAANPAPFAGLAVFGRHAVASSSPERLVAVTGTTVETRPIAGTYPRTGSVEVNELMVLESYTHVHHIVSNVRGTLRKHVTPAQIIRAVFPGGTITGCPKVRCMQIIAELEGRVRGPYTGAFAYFNRDGSGDSNILIRTIGIDGDEVEVRAGAGIVADSHPERELDETRAKARGPLSALEGLLE